MFDLIIGLFGLPRSVMARVDTLVQPYEVEGSSAVLLELHNGAPVIARFHWNSKTWIHDFEIVGSEAKVRWFSADTGKVIRTTGRDVEELDLPNAENAHTPLVENFTQAIIEGHEPVVPVAEAAKTNTLFDAIYESGRTGMKVNL